MMEQNNKIENKIKMLGGNDFIADDGKIVTFCQTNNAIYVIDPVEGSSNVFLGDEKITFIEDCFGKMSLLNGKILLTPWKGNTICILEGKSGRVINLPIAKYEHKISSNGNFWEVISFKNNFYVFGYGCPDILKINCETLKMEPIVGWVDDFKCLDKKEKNDPAEWYFFDGYARYESQFYFQTGIKSTLFRFDCEKDSYEFIKIPMSITKIACISSNEGWIWMTDMDFDRANVCIWNVKSGEVRNLVMPTKGMWYAPVFYDNYAYLFPYGNDGRVYQINTLTYEIKLFEELDRLFLDVESSKHIYDVARVKIENGKISFIRRPDYTFFTYDLAIKELTANKYLIHDEAIISSVLDDYYDQKYAEYDFNSDIVSENDMPLNEYIKRI